MPNEIFVELLRHPSGHWAAVSDQVRGLMVTGVSQDDVLSKVPDVLSAITEAETGTSVQYVVDAAPDSSDESAKPRYVARNASAQEAYF